MTYMDHVITGCVEYNHSINEWPQQGVWLKEAMQIGIFYWKAVY